MSIQCIRRPPRRAPSGLASLGRTNSFISDCESQTGRGISGSREGFIVVIVPCPTLPSHAVKLVDIVVVSEPRFPIHEKRTHHTGFLRSICERRKHSAIFWIRGS